MIDRTVRFENDRILYHGNEEPYTQFYPFIRESLEHWRGQLNDKGETGDSMGIQEWLCFVKAKIPCGNCNRFTEHGDCLMLGRDGCYHAGHGSKYDMDTFVLYRTTDTLHGYPIICDECVPVLSGNERRLLFKDDNYLGYTTEMFLNDRKITPTPEKLDQVIDHLTKALARAHKLKSKLVM